MADTTLEKLQNSAVSWAYDLDPVKKNLYRVSSFTVNDIISNNESGESKYKYRLQSINIPQISLSFENTFAVNRDPTITSAEKKWDITIDWLESYDRKVQKDHIEWFNSWYNYDGDHLMAGSLGELIIEVLNDDSSTVYTITIHDMIPKSLPSIEFGYDNSGDSKYTVTYSYSYGTFAFPADNGTKTYYF